MININYSLKSIEQLKPITAVIESSSLPDAPGVTAGVKDISSPTSEGTILSISSLFGFELLIGAYDDTIPFVGLSYGATRFRVLDTRLGAEFEAREPYAFSIPRNTTVYILGSANYQWFDREIS